MRELSTVEMAAVAGGHDPSNPPKGIELPRVILDGQRVRDSYDNQMFHLLMAHVNYVPPDDNDPNHQDQYFLANVDPLLDAPPTGVDVQDMRQAALLVQDYVKGKNPNIEYSAVLYADQAGNIRIGPIGEGTSTGVPYLSDQRAGERIVALIHSHPQLSPNTDHSLPSTYASNGATSQNDERTAAELIAAGALDQKGLMYIIDNASGQMYEYDPQSISVQNRNNITDDLAQYGPSYGH